MSGLRIVQVPRTPTDQKAVLMEQTRPGLMQQYRNSTSKLLMSLTVDADSANYLWTDLVMDLATRHSYLYHSLLAISALHTEMLQPSEKTALLALEHRNISLSLFRQALSEGFEDIDALFACQCMVLLYTLGANGRNVSLLALKDMLTVLRGSRVIVSGGGQALVSGPFGRMIELNPDGADSDMPPGAQAMLTDLLRRLDTSISAKACQQVYVSTLALLRYVLPLTPHPQYDQIVVNTFFLMVDQEFLNLVFLGEPPALSILANYAVCLHIVGERNLFVRPWAKQILRVVREQLPSEWQGSIVWATKQIEG